MQPFFGVYMETFSSVKWPFWWNTTLEAFKFIPEISPEKFDMRKTNATLPVEMVTTQVLSRKCQLTS